jgi:hypothetical protein
MSHRGRKLSALAAATSGKLMVYQQGLLAAAPMTGKCLGGLPGRKLI